MPIRMEDDPMDQQDFDESSSSGGGSGGSGGGLLSFLPMLLALFGRGVGKAGAGVKIYFLFLGRAEMYFFFFRDTGQIVVKACAVDNIFCRLFDIRCFIHNPRRIPCACSDHLFAGR